MVLTVTRCERICFLEGRHEKGFFSLPSPGLFVCDLPADLHDPYAQLLLIQTQKPSRERKGLSPQANQPIPTLKLAWQLDHLVRDRQLLVREA
jgi:hypothetical protein